MKKGQKRNHAWQGGKAGGPRTTAPAQPAECARRAGRCKARAQRTQGGRAPIFAPRSPRTVAASFQTASTAQWPVPSRACGGNRVRGVAARDHVGLWRPRRAPRRDPIDWPAPSRTRLVRGAHRGPTSHWPPSPRGRCLPCTARVRACAAGRGARWGTRAGLFPVRLSVFAGRATRVAAPRASAARGERAWQGARAGKGTHRAGGAGLGAGRHAKRREGVPRTDKSAPPPRSVSAADACADRWGSCGAARGACGGASGAPHRFPAARGAGGGGGGAKERKRRSTGVGWLRGLTGS